MKDTFEFTLKENPSEELLEVFSDVNVETTPSFTIQDTHGNIAEYLKVIRCKDCKLNGFCVLSHTELAGEGYCAWSEPKEEKR